MLLMLLLWLWTSEMLLLLAWLLPLRLLGFRLWRGLLLLLWSSSAGAAKNKRLLHLLPKLRGGPLLLLRLLLRGWRHSSRGTSRRRLVEEPML